MRLKTYLVLFVIVLLLGTTLAMAQPPAAPGDQPPSQPGMQGPRMGAFPMTFSRCAATALRAPVGQTMNALKTQLALTDDQAAKVQELATKSSERMKTLTAQQTKAINDLVKAAANPSGGKTELDKAAADAAKAESEMIMSQAAFWGDVKALLTAEQKTKLQEFLQRPAGMISPGGMGPQGGSPPGRGPGGLNQPRSQPRQGPPGQAEQIPAAPQE